jgi:hypothetical protein
MRYTKGLLSAALALGALTTAAGALLAGDDFGLFRDNGLRAQSEKLFGVSKPLTESSSLQVTAAEAEADPNVLYTLAKGLKGRIVTAGVAGG